MLRSLRFAVSAIAFQRWRLAAAIILLSVFACASALLAQAGFDDDRFCFRDSIGSRIGTAIRKIPSYGDKHWYDIVQNSRPPSGMAAST